MVTAALKGGLQAGEVMAAVSTGAGFQEREPLLLCSHRLALAPQKILALRHAGACQLKFATHLGASWHSPRVLFPSA